MDWTWAPSSPALLTDLYELTMAAAYVAEDMAETTATFSLFVRALPPTRGYLVAAGLDGVLAYLEALRFTDDDLACLEGLDLLGAPALERLARLRFTGSVRAVPEGTVVFAGEPILEVTAPMVEAQLVETLILNLVTTGTTLASKAARYRYAAGDRTLAEFALRRCQGVDAALHLVRAARICGLESTSNVAGARRFGLPASGTMAHSFVQAHRREVDAFRAFTALFGPATVLLVDTFDPWRGIERAVAVAREAQEGGVTLRALRLDSGDLAALARHARDRLDDAGCPEVGVIASGGLDEDRIAELVAEGAPIDGFGVGSDLGVSGDAPVIDTVYKLVEFGGRPVRKRSPGKETWPGAKQVWRGPGWGGDVLALVGEEPPAPAYRPLLVEVMAGGTRTPAGRESLAAAADRFGGEWGSLPEEVRRLHEPRPVAVAPSPALVRATADLGGQLDR
ncbi:MAG TPA: nicotinate phosphoribosyltransferase [Acidimicrobiales bacterium]|nr:nicotinate phosphoribosyltransferase [Acidimicrobiales bacterium]